MSAFDKQPPTAHEQQQHQQTDYSLCQVLAIFTFFRLPTLLLTPLVVVVVAFKILFLVSPLCT